MVRLVIDGRQVEAEEGKTVLEAAESVGIKIPTLCYHKALLPHGACRLCVVEITQRPRLAASCAYPVEEGIEVKTASPRVIKARKLIMGLLLLRCPDVPKLKELAKEIGVDEAILKRFKPDEEKCILCGLCARVCRERMKVGAIDFVNRGYKRKISPPFDEFSPICVTCGACEVVCPTGAIDLSKITRNKPRPILSEYDMGLGGRRSIYIPFPQAVPRVPVIDRDTCTYFLRDACRSCENFCGPKAINYDQKDEIIDIEVGAIIIAPGFELFDPHLKPDLGFGIYPNVISSLQFERLLSPTGPTGGKIQRPSDSKPPKSIAFIQCVGSRDYERDYCSAVCCMYATKEAILAKEYLGEELRCDIFYMDMRAFSKGFEEYYNRAKSLGINYIRCRPPIIKEVPETRNLRIEYLTEDDRKQVKEYEMVILSAGLAAPKYAREIAEKFGLELNKYGFCPTSLFTPVSTPRDGIYVAGVFTGPKDIPESVMQGCAASAKVLSLLASEKGKLIKEKVYPPERDVRGEEPRVGVFVCHCGKNIAGVINSAEVAEYARTLPNVAYADHFLYACSTDSGEKIKQAIREHNLNRVVVAACTPRTHEPLFQSVIQEAGLNPYLFEMANIRDHCTWVHTYEPEAALKKAKDLVRMAVAKARLIEPLYRKKVKINREALVIGGGISGLTAALGLADQGFETYLIERSDALGGNLRQVKFLLNGDNPQQRLNQLIERAQHHPKIHIYTNSQITNIEGSIGNFTTEFKYNGTVQSIKSGVIIVATGAQEYKPSEYLYGKDKRVITQLELEEKLANNQLLTPQSAIRNPKSAIQTVVMLQCVGSRDEKHPYCSRICCQQAIKNALRIREQNPKTHVYVLYRDMRTYGFNESYYTRAREKGVRFIIYDVNKRPTVEQVDGYLKVSVYDPVIDADINLKADLLVLSTGVIPRDDAKELAQKLKVPLTADGFFLEAHMKLRPVDFATDGIFLCGLAHFPKTVDESIAQALAVVSRASTILSKEEIEIEATISQVIDENCDGCAYCVDPCPFKAITLIEYMKDGAIKKTVEVDELKCKGCGTCQATCPKRGIIVRNFRLDQISAMVEAALSRS